MEKDERLLALRPTLSIDLNGDKSPMESFMHKTLRPVLKLQHQLICDRLNAEKHLKVPQSKPHLEQTNYLLTFLQKNPRVKSELIGMITGMFTAQEFSIYLDHKSETTKRITTMLAERYLSSLSQ